VNWLEIIIFRVGGGPSHQDALRLLSSLAESAGDNGLKVVKVYSRTDLPADFCIHLEWQVERLPSNGSAMGVRLAHALRDFGLINHTVWMEEEKNETALYSG